MAGLGPAIYETPHKVLVDDRAKPGHERSGKIHDSRIVP